MNDHPKAADGIGITKSALWFGPEVEGRLRAARLWTAFISAPLGNEDFARLEREVSRGKVEHFFLTEIFGARERLAGEAFKWVGDVLLPLLAGARPVTIARFGRDVDVLEVLQQPWSGRVSLMVRANEEATWMRRLRSGDQVSVGVPYELTTWRVEDGVATKPEDYAQDER